MKISKNRIRPRGQARGLLILSGSLLLCFALISCAGTGKRTPVAGTALDGATIIDNYVEATGGLQAYEKIQNRITKGTFAIPQAGLQGSVTFYHARPNQMYSLLEIEGLGKTESGISGDVAWEMSLTTGPRVKEDDERAVALRDATFDRLAYWRKVFDQAIYTGITEINSQPCYIVIVTSKAGTGNPQTLYFNQETNLIVMVKAIFKSQMGTIPVETFVSDYMEVDGILLPRVTKVVIMDQERIITTESVEHNVQLPAGIFDLPPEVQALLEKSDDE